MNQQGKSSLNANIITMVILSEVHGVINTSQKLLLKMVMKNHSIHHKNYLKWRSELMKFSKDIARDIMIIISSQVFTFSIQIKKVDSEVAGS